MKLCQIYNSAAHYRTSIFLLIDQTWDCDYVFGARLGDIKQMDTSLLRGKVTKVENKKLHGAWYWQPGVLKQLRKDYDTYIILGDTHSLSTWAFGICARLFHRKKKVFFWSHGWYGKETSLERKVKKLFFRLPNGGTFLYGNYAKRLMIAEGFDPNRLFVIHNSLAYEKQLQIRKNLKETNVYQKHFDNDYPNLFFVGRLTAVKKLDMIFEAMSVCRKEGIMYNLTLIGGGEKEKELKEKAVVLGLEKYVWFYGPCYDENVLGEMIYNADLCVSPGNVGLTAMHVMVFGTPVITHNNFARQMPEFEAIVKGKTGCFFQEDSISSLAQNINNWFKEHNGKRGEVRQACYHEIDTQWTPQFQLEVLKEHLEEYC